MNNRKHGFGREGWNGNIPLDSTSRRPPLYIPYQNPDPNHRSRRKYGDKLDWSNISDEYLRQSIIEENIQTDTYQASLLHKEFAQPLNVVILVKTNLKTNARSHVILFSSTVWRK